MLTRLLLSLSLLGLAAAQELEHPASFPKVNLQGTARPDAGYTLERVTVDGKVYSPEQLDQAGRAALLASGWKSADTKKRQKLALDWCTQVVLAGQVVESPRAQLGRDGKIHVRLRWTRSGGNVAGALRPSQSGHWTVGPDATVKRLSYPGFTTEGTEH